MTSVYKIKAETIIGTETRENFLPGVVKDGLVQAGYSREADGPAPSSHQ